MDKMPEDRWSLVKFRSSWSDDEIQAYRQDEPFETGPIVEEDALTAYERVLKSGGAILPRREAVDSRIVKDVRSLTGRIIKSQEEVGSWPELASLPAPKDTDHDGMPDNWETKNGLDPNYRDDRNIVGDDGYTMLEIYLNGM